LVTLMRKRLVVYVGYDGRSASILRRARSLAPFFDDLTVIYVPESDPEVLSALSIPSAVVEDIA